MPTVDETRLDQAIESVTNWDALRQYVLSIIRPLHLGHSTPGPRLAIALADCLIHIGFHIERIAIAQERIADAAELPPGGGGPP